MNKQEAVDMMTRYYRNPNPTPEDEFLFVEGVSYLIRVYHNPEDMHNLAFYYLEKRDFKLEQKYLEMAAEYGLDSAFEELGYMWYYGQTGTVDMKKAFEYFSIGAQSKDDIMRIACELKIADMYHFGYYVEKDEKKYREIIERIFREAMHPQSLISRYHVAPLHEIAYRIAGIRMEDGEEEEALKLIEMARETTARILRDTIFWGNVEVMDNIVCMQHQIVDIPVWQYDIFDLFFVAKEPCVVVFYYLGAQYRIEVVSDEEGTAIRFLGKWYRDARDFFENARLAGKRIAYLYRDFYCLDVLAA